MSATPLHVLGAPIARLPQSPVHAVMNGVGPRLVPRPAVGRDGGSKLDVGHGRDIRGCCFAHRALVAGRVRQPEPDAERVDERGSVRSIPGVGRVTEMGQDLPLGRQAANRAAGDGAPAPQPGRGIREDPPGRQRLQRVTVPGEHGRVQIDATVFGRGEDEPHGKRVHHRRESQTTERCDHRFHLVEPDNQVEIVVGPSLSTYQRVDAPAAVHPHVHSRRLEGVDHGDRGFGGHHVQTMARMGRCRSPSSSSLS